MPPPHSSPVIIIGGGVAGLTAARSLHEAKRPFLLFEAAPAPGGRVATDAAMGFRIDRGFQVFLSAYPEARRWLDYEQLDLRPYRPGALIRKGGRFSLLSDPLRRPADLFPTLTSPLATLADKIRILRLRRKLQCVPLAAIWEMPERTTLEFLRAEGFSETIIECFFRPFLSGIFLERDLSTSARFFAFVFKMMGEGEVMLPALGINAIPAELARPLPAESLRFGTKVTALEPSASGTEWVISFDANPEQWERSLAASAPPLSPASAGSFPSPERRGVLLSTPPSITPPCVSEDKDFITPPCVSGEGDQSGAIAPDWWRGARRGARRGTLTQIQASHVILATDAQSAAALLPGLLTPPPFHRVHTFVFSAPAGALPRPATLLLNTDEGWINHIAPISDVATGTAPADRLLLMVNVLRDPLPEDPEAHIRRELTDWFGPATAAWELLRQDTITHALPTFPAGLPGPRQASALRPGLILAGDYLRHPSLQGAMESGRLAADHFLATSPSPA
jgi:glycine/D-amino acid oxidase-like deaminating enzyme